MSKFDSQGFPLPTIDETRIETWFERDRANVRLVHEGDPDNDLIDIWDEEVHQAVEDGFLDPKDWYRSAYDWWFSMQ